MSVEEFDWNLGADDGDDLASAAPTAPNEMKTAQTRLSRSVAVVYVGLANVNAHTNLIFIHSETNPERLLHDDGQHSIIYAIRSQQDTRNRFVIGLPYTIQTQDAYMGDAPDETEIFQICGVPEDITPYKTSSTMPSPVIRCTFTGSYGKKVNCQPTELHEIRLYSPPVFYIYKDMVPGSSGRGGDYLLKMRVGEFEGRLFPSVERLAGVCATLARGNSKAVILLDTPPLNFVMSVCKEKKVYLAIGCANLPSTPTITVSDILLAGGMGELKTRDQVQSFITTVLGAKYLNSDCNAPASTTPDGKKLGMRTLSIIKNRAVKKDYTTLIWAGPNEGITLAFGRALCLLMKGENYRPHMITTCNGGSSYASNDDFFEINPSLFPRHEFDWVSFIDGCVNVSNPLADGKPSSHGS